MFKFNVKNVRFRYSTVMFFLLVLLSACTSSDKTFEYGTQILAAHKVSMYEVLGDSVWYDGQPVMLRGVARFHFGVERLAGLYASKDDYDNKTYGWLVLEFSDIDDDNEEGLMTLNGRYVYVSGIYRAFERNPILMNESNEQISICKGLCGAAGYIEVRSVN